MKFKLLKAIDTDFNSDFKGLAERSDQWHQIKESYYGFFEAMDKLEFTDETFRCSGGYALYLNAHGDGKWLTQIVRALRTTGWKTDNDPPKKNSSSWEAKFHRVSQEPGNEGRVLPNHIYLSFYSTVCKRVQVGTKMEEVPVYDVQCEDLTIEQDQLATEVPPALT